MYIAILFKWKRKRIQNIDENILFYINKKHKKKAFNM